MQILAFVETRDNKIRSAGLEALSAANTLKEKLGGQLSALLIGEGSKQLAGETGKYGATKAYAVEGADFAGYSPEAYREAVLAAVKASAADAVVLSATTLGKDLAPMLAAKLDASFLPDCTSLEVEGGRLTVKRPVYGGRCLITLASGDFPAVISLRPKSFLVADLGGSAAAVEALAVDVAGKIKTRFVEARSEAAGKLDVSEADIIVTGGRGLKGPENFGLVEELAGVLGGAVGASRAVVDAGWRSHSEQIGQTGKVVNPTLYIAAGISGAIQHLAGMRSSKVIVAINKDPEAPIFKSADYGIVGDALEVLPALTKAIQALV
jgi:electron transfer flavoprotein alpha subunit